MGTWYSFLLEYACLYNLRKWLCALRPHRQHTLVTLAREMCESWDYTQRYIQACGDCFLRRARKNHVLVFFVLPAGIGLSSSPPPVSHLLSCGSPILPTIWLHFASAPTVMLLLWRFFHFAIIFSSARCLNERIKNENRERVWCCERRKYRACG